MTSPISRRIAAISASPTMAITARAAALRAAGRPVIGFAAGEPDFPTPPHIVEAARAAAGDPRLHHYTPAAGLPELREAVAAKTRRDSGIEIDAGEVAITVGAKGAVHAACAALLDPGDEVLLPSPYWVSYPEIIGLAGGVTRLVPSSIEEGFKVSVDALEAARTPNTRMLIFVSPGNPTGAVCSPEQVAEIGRWAARHGIWVLTDEIYEHFVYGDARFASLPAAAPEAASRCVVINSVAKTYAMTGWRVGWLVAPAEVTSAVIRFQSHTLSHPSNIAQAAALAAVEGSMEPVASMRSAFDRRRIAMHGALAAIPGVQVLEPEGAFYCFPSVRGMLGRELGGVRPESSAELAVALLEQAEIAVVPGEAFGAPGYLRLSFALADDDLEEGMGRWRSLVG